MRKFLWAGVGIFLKCDSLAHYVHFDLITTITNPTASFRSFIYMMGLVFNLLNVVGKFNDVDRLIDNISVESFMVS